MGQESPEAKGVVNDQYDVGTGDEARAVGKKNRWLEAAGVSEDPGRSTRCDGKVINSVR